MAFLEVENGDNRQLQNIANTIAAAKKIVVITGAGISTNCGIPVSITWPSMAFVTEFSPGLSIRARALRSHTGTERCCINEGCLTFSREENASHSTRPTFNANETASQVPNEAAVDP